MKISTCEVGLFKLPGVVLDKEEVTDQVLFEMDNWALTEQGHGCKRISKVLWSFKNTGQRDWFILRWSGA